MRYIKILIVVYIINFAPMLHAAQHMYYYGAITSLYSNQISLNGQPYDVSLNVKVILRVVGSNGAIHEQIGSLSDIGIGSDVAIKVVNGVVTEIEVVVKR